MHGGVGRRASRREGFREGGLPQGSPGPFLCPSLSLEHQQECVTIIVGRDKRGDIVTNKERQDLGRPCKVDSQQEQFSGMPSAGRDTPNNQPEKKINTIALWE